MKLLFKVDQKAALLKGHDAPDSTIQLDVDPAELTDSEREMIASVLLDGHDCTRGSVNTGDCSCSSIVLDDPTLAGLKRELARIQALRDEKAQKALEKQRQADAEVAATIAAGAETREQTVCLFPDGVDFPRNVSPLTTRKVELPSPRRVNYYGASSEAAARYEEYEADCLRQAQAIMTNLRPSLYDQYERECAEKQRREKEQKVRREAQQSEYQQFYARLPESLRERNEAGYATEQEVSTAIYELILKEHHFSEAARDYHESEKITSLTDAEFSRLKQVRESLLDRGFAEEHGATADAYEVPYYRPATDDDSDDEIDDDGDVKDYDRCIIVAWEQAGLDIAARVPFE